MKNHAPVRQFEKPAFEFSNKATILSFVMALFVVSIHANNLKYYGLEDVSTSLAYQEIKILSGIIGGMAVPFFFMISGYWFFRMDINSDGVWKNVKTKIKKKSRTLVIPYVLWNAFTMAFYIVISRIPILAAQMNNGEVFAITLRNIGGGYYCMSPTFLSGICRI